MVHENGSAAKKSGQTAKPVRAAEYVRMSTDHQRYSTENQSDAIRDYASSRGIKIVKTYADEGKSGLSVDGRGAFKQLIEDVTGGRAEFDVILVYDVSRWGRFQDTDESAYYEYICRRAGIGVEFCAEQFENDGSPIATIVKGVKKAMAGEYSRELSVKVFAGQGRLIELGYRQGGPPGYGLRRALVDQAGNFKGELAFGEHKSIQTDRVILVAGPEYEIETIRRIYRRFVEDGVPEREIAHELNHDGLTRERGLPWTRGSVHQVLINEKYIGNNVWNRTSFKLKKKRVRNTPDKWIRADGVFPEIVSHELFYVAREMIQQRSFRMTDAEMLDGLALLRKGNGILSGLIIDEADGLPSSAAYRSRFGSLLRAYRLVGYTPRRDYRYIEINRELRALHPQIISNIIARLERTGCRVRTETGNPLVSINNELTISVVVSRCTRTPAGALRWRVRFDTGLQPDITIAVRMNEANSAPLDYYVLPAIDIAAARLRLCEDNGLGLDAYRFDTLEPFYELMTPQPVPEAA